MILFFGPTKVIPAALDAFILYAARTRCCAVREDHALPVSRRRIIASVT